MNIRQSPGQFKPDPTPFSHVICNSCLGEARPVGGGWFFAVAVIDGCAIWLGLYPSRRLACAAVIDAHQGAGHD